VYSTDEKELGSTLIEGCEKGILEKFDEKYN